MEEEVQLGEEADLQRTHTISGNSSKYIEGIKYRFGQEFKQIFNQVDDYFQEGFLSVLYKDFSFKMGLFIKVGHI